MANIADTSMVRIQNFPEDGAGGGGEGGNELCRQVYVTGIAAYLDADDHSNCSTSSRHASKIRTDMDAVPPTAPSAPGPPSHLQPGMLPTLFASCAAVFTRAISSFLFKAASSFWPSAPEEKSMIFNAVPSPRVSNLPQSWINDHDRDGDRGGRSFGYAHDEHAAEHCRRVEIKPGRSGTLAFAGPGFVSVASCICHGIVTTNP